MTDGLMNSQATTFADLREISNRVIEAHFRHSKLRPNKPV
jgi:hypothetical protein